MALSVSMCLCQPIETLAATIHKKVKSVERRRLSLSIAELNKVRPPQVTNSLKDSNPAVPHLLQEQYSAPELAGVVTAGTNKTLAVAVH